MPLSAQRKSDARVSECTCLFLQMGVHNGTQTGHRSGVCIEREAGGGGERVKTLWERKGGRDTVTSAQPSWNIDIGQLYGLAWAMS